MYKVLRSFVFVLIQILIIGAAEIHGQSAYANLEGQTVGVDGRPLAGITITAANQATGVAKSVVSSADGFYRVLGLRPGTYDVTYSFPIYFRVRKNVQLNVGQNITIQFEIDTRLKETVTIIAELPIIETTKSKVDQKLVFCNVKLIICRSMVEHFSDLLFSARA